MCPQPMACQTGRWTIMAPPAGLVWCGGTRIGAVLVPENLYFEVITDLCDPFEKYHQSNISPAKLCCGVEVHMKKR